MWYGGAGAAGAALLGYIGYTFYVAAQLTLAEESMMAYDYGRAIAFAEKYEELAERTPKSLLLLARAEMFSGDLDKLADTLQTYDGNETELMYLKAAGLYFNDPDAAYQILNGLGGERAEGRPYIGAADGVFALLENDWRRASPLFEDIGSYKDEIVNLHLWTLFNLFLENTELKLSGEGPLQFSRPQNPIDRELGFAVGVEGFYNIFSVPLSKDAIAGEYSPEKIPSIYRGLYALAEAQILGRENAVQFAAAEGGKDASLLARYLAGYYFALDGKYEEAVATYRGISEDSEHTLAAQYESSALWAGKDGAVPSERATERVQRAAELNSQNMAALNNAAYWEFVFGDVEKAKELIEQAAAIDDVNRFVVLNRLAIDAAGGALDYTAAQPQIAALMAQSPESQTALNLGIFAEIRLRNLSQAINLLNRMRELRPEDPRARAANRRPLPLSRAAVSGGAGAANRKHAVSGQYGNFRRAGGVSGD